MGYCSRKKLQRKLGHAGTIDRQFQSVEDGLFAYHASKHTRHVMSGRLIWQINHPTSDISWTSLNGCVAMKRLFTRLNSKMTRRYTAMCVQKYGGRRAPDLVS